ncbi:phosphate transport system substrate-binding protein [Sporosarcina luteola]|nr:phosphate transport system substrate-binding protein [Sporosarcina luteola]
MKLAGRIVSLAGFILLVSFFAVPLGLFLLFGENGEWLPVLIGGFLAFIVIVGMAIFNVRRRSVFYGIPLVIFFVGCVVAIPGFYKLTKPVVETADVDLSEYAPNTSGTKAVKLEQSASFLIEKDLPKLDGATALYPVYAAFVQAVYPEKYYDPYDSEVMSNRTGQAYENLLDGQVDIIFALGPSEAQRKKAEERGKELILTPIGKEAFVFFVNKENPVKGLTQEQLRDIYSGKLTNWKEVGGNRAKIRAFQRPADSGSQTALEEFMGDVPIMKAPTEEVADLMSGIITYVADYRNYDGAIGFTFRFYSESMIGNSDIRLLAVDGADPTVETVRSGAYPITRELYAITAGSENPNVKAFIDWILSDEGQELVEKTGYVGMDSDKDETK